MAAASPAPPAWEAPQANDQAPQSSESSTPPAWEPPRTDDTEQVPAEPHAEAAGEQPETQPWEAPAGASNNNDQGHPEGPHDARDEATMIIPTWRPPAPEAEEAVSGAPGGSGESEQAAAHEGGQEAQHAGEEQAPAVAAAPGDSSLTETMFLSPNAAPGSGAAAPTMAEAELTIETGPDSGHMYRLTGPALRVGRSPDNELILRDPATSGHHARVERRGNQFFVVDLGSTNGTMVNGETIQERELHHGDRITIGQNAVKFSLI
jgi:hypothetical protein